MAFLNYVGLDYGDETVTSTTESRGVTLGTKGLMPDGRVFRYSLAGEAGGTAVTKDQYKGGTLYVNDGDGEGQTFRIATHAAVSSSGAFTVPFEGKQTVKTALTASSLTGIKANPYNGTLIYTTGAVDPHVATGDDNMNVALVCSPISVTTDYQHVFIIMGS